MSSEINLLPQKKEEVSSTKVLRILRISSTALLLVVTVSSVGLFLLNLNSPLSKLKKEEGDLLKNLGLYQSRISNHLAIQDRLKNISVILSQRGNFDEKLSTIIQNVPSNVSVNALSIDKKSIKITLSSPSLSSLNAFSDSVVRLAQDKKIFKKVLLNTLSFDGKKEEYLLSIEADLL